MHGSEAIHLHSLLSYNCNQAKIKEKAGQLLCHIWASNEIPLFKWMRLCSKHHKLLGLLFCWWSHGQRRSSNQRIQVIQNLEFGPQKSTFSGTFEPHPKPFRILGSPQTHRPYFLSLLQVAPILRRNETHTGDGAFRACRRLLSIRDRIRWLSR